MGSDRKSKETSRKRTSDSQSHDEEKPKRHRRSSDEYAEEGTGKRDKKEKSLHTKSQKRDSTKEKKHKSKHSKHDRKSIPDFKELSKDDYFLKNNEFSTWLTEEKKKFFSDLSSDLARELFSEFVEVWNSKKLRSKYYKGIKTGPRSSHSWKLKD